MTDIPHEHSWTSVVEATPEEMARDFISDAKDDAASPLARHRHGPPIEIPEELLRDDSDVSSDGTSDEIPEELRAFHGQTKCRTIPDYKREKPIHRVILFLRAQGLSYREISETTGMSPSGVCWVCQQTWFKKQLVALLNSQGLDPVKELIRTAAVDSVYKVIELRDKAKSENVQMNSAFDLLDRYLGKSVQPIGPEKPPIADEARLDAEIAELQKKVNLN